MSKQNKIARLTAGPSPRKKPRGRTSGGASAAALPHGADIADKAKSKLEKMTDVNRGQGKPSTRGGKNRGDRRDMSPTYTGNAKHAARGNTPRRDVETRAR
jgi:hypothetical protein